MSKYNEKRKASNQRWDAKNIKRVSIALPIDSIPLIQAKANEAGLSMHKFLLTCIESYTGLTLTAESKADSENED